MLISGITIVLVILGATVSPWFLAIAIVLGAFLMQSVMRQLSEIHVSALSKIWEQTYQTPNPDEEPAMTEARKDTLDETWPENEDPEFDPKLDDMETPLPRSQSFSKFLKTFSPKT